MHETFLLFLGTSIFSRNYRLIEIPELCVYSTTLTRSDCIPTGRQLFPGVSGNIIAKALRNLAFYNSLIYVNSALS